MTLTEEFLAHYKKYKAHYANAAAICAQQCEAILKQSGKQAIVSHRAKNIERLARKLSERRKRKRYKKLDDILEDIPDLAGVRIALYFPNDKGEVEKLINVTFVVEKAKTFPESRRPNKFESSYGDRFSGYGAQHYHVRLKDGEYKDARIEIQVASVLMHAWAEVEHDLLYKQLKGDPSQSERALLDQINGLVLAGEIALEQLQNAIKARLNLKEHPFNNHYELAAYLYDELIESTNERTMGRADVLFKFLQLMGKNRPKEIDDYLKQLDPQDEHSIVDQLVDLIITGDEPGYEKYSQARKEVDAGSHGVEGGAKRTIPGFVDKWIKFEAKTRSITEWKLGNYKGSLSPSVLRRIKIFSDTELKIIESLRWLRNQIVHGTDEPQSDIAEAEEQIAQLLNRLEGQYPLGRRRTPGSSKVSMESGHSDS